ncbi:hypothetical protein LIER_43399 [Lithospermum erythrorhizon]|uniref:Uncharacterized protein n=1 Tax=Lithospermum erythrorhizon TaxID=34254 RepID=A0AAV3PZN9_LITER
MEADLARVLGALDIEGDKLGEVIVPDVNYDRVEEQYQYILIVRVLAKNGFMFNLLRIRLRRCGEATKIWNLPLGYVDVDFGRAIGAYIGEVIEVDHRSIEHERGRYVRVKVKLDIHSH